MNYNRAFYGWELNDFLSCYSPNLYLGCFPRDKIPKLLHGQCCIVNSAKSGPGEVGVHWMCYAQSYLFGLMVLDSNGTDIKTIRANYPYKSAQFCHYNVETLTEPNSSYCGLYSTFFATLHYSTQTNKCLEQDVANSRLYFGFAGCWLANLAKFNKQ